MWVNLRTIQELVRPRMTRQSTNKVINVLSSNPKARYKAAHQAMRVYVKTTEAIKNEARASA